MQFKPGLGIFVAACATLWGVDSLRAAEVTARGYYELRLYSVTSNKLDGVQERFRETVEPVRRTAIALGGQAVEYRVSTVHTRDHEYVNLLSRSA